MINIKDFFHKFCIMFTVTTLTYGGFDKFTNNNDLFQKVFLQCIGVSVLFSIAITILDYLSNKIKILSSNCFIWIQFTILISILISWAKIFNWGNLGNKTYALIFIGSFTLIYLFVYFYIDLSNKKGDSEINQKLKAYQNNKLE